MVTSRACVERGVKAVLFLMVLQRPPSAFCFHLPSTRPRFQQLAASTNNKVDTTEATKALRKLLKQQEAELEETERLLDLLESTAVDSKLPDKSNNEDYLSTAASLYVGL